MGAIIGTKAGSVYLKSRAPPAFHVAHSLTYHLEQKVLLMGSR